MVFRSLAFVREEIETTDHLIHECGYEAPTHFRSPFGKRLLIVPYYLRTTGRLNIYYDVEPESYTEIMHDAGRITEHVLAETRPGSIILLHVMSSARGETMHAVPGIIEGLQARDQVAQRDQHRQQRPHLFWKWRSLSQQGRGRPGHDLLDKGRLAAPRIAQQGQTL